MDKLLSRKSKIQKFLARRHLKDSCLILYDITNIYLEGEYNNSELANFGFSKDEKKGKKQIAIGLLTDKDGCPVAVEVFEGNISEQSTVLDRAKELANSYGVKNVIIAGDRGILKSSNIEEINQLGSVLSKKKI